ncbi:MAG: tetratricopeptide repeat protein [Oscillospiraceae bacterium]|nr:tetratricopeptide repeat protein [Oscillospiraceae bacterium]
MRENYNRRLPSLWDRFSAFIVRIIPWLAAHVFLGLCIGSLYAIRRYGAENAEIYYFPPIICGALAAILGGWAYYSFGRVRSEYEINKLGNFDRALVFGYFYGSDAKLLREAVIDMHLSDLNGALEKFKWLEEKELPDDRRSVLCFYMGRCYQLMGYPSNGVKYFQEALDKGLKLSDTYLLTARCLTQNGRFDEALECYNTLLEKDCYFDFIYTDMGIACLKKGDGEKALEYFTKSVDEGKNYSFALGGCSLAYLQMKDLDKSREYYRQALTCNMDDVNGFKIFYCNIAEAVGLFDEIDPQMKLRSEAGFEHGDEIIR